MRSASKTSSGRGDQIEAIVALFREQIAMYSAPGRFAEQLDFSIRVLGRLEMLDEKTRDAAEKAVEATRKGKLILNLCVAYTSHDEQEPSRRNRFRTSWTRRTIRPWTSWSDRRGCID
jgi:undecaprenyl diphosphate synthase